MKFAACLSTRPNLGDACGEASAGLASRLEGARADLVFAFASATHGALLDSLPERIAREFPGAVLLGCQAQSVLAEGHEIEQGPGLSLVAASLPDVEIRPFHLDPAAGSSGAADDLLPTERDQAPHFVLLADPFTAPTEQVLQMLDTALPESVTVGGLASGGNEPGANALFVCDRVHRRGIAGVALAGDVELDPIVAQGCKPIGQPLFVTRSDRNLLFELDSQRPVDVLQELFSKLEPEDQALFQGSLFVGFAMREGETRYRQGDFLIRNVLGMDQTSGALAVGGDLSAARVVQFHLRDARTSAEDLTLCLSRYRQAQRPSEPEGALLFSCLGRGASLYGESGHDSKSFAAQLPGVPLGGFFANGEIGPVQSRTYLHSYTSSFAVFRRAQKVN